MRANAIPALFPILLGAATPAAAIDLTGVWVQTRDFSCKLYREGTTEKISVDFSPISIQHDGVNVLAGGEIVTSEGVVVADSKGVGHGLIRRCVGSEPWIFRIYSAKTFPENAKGVSGRMVMEFLNSDVHPDGSGIHNACKKVAFERTSTATPLLMACP
jgi:hypothetical protein